MTLYVMGAGYFKGDTVEHALVKPTKGNPYVFTRPMGSTYRLCQHHAFLYQLSEDCTMAHLVQRSVSVIPGMVAPQILTLSDEDRLGILARINGQGSEGIYWD